MSKKKHNSENNIKQNLDETIRNGEDLSSCELEKEDNCREQ